MFHLSLEKYAYVHVQTIYSNGEKQHAYAYIFVYCISLRKQIWTDIFYRILVDVENTKNDEKRQIQFIIIHVICMLDKFFHFEA